MIKAGAFRPLHKQIFSMKESMGFFYAVNPIYHISELIGNMETNLTHIYPCLLLPTTVQQNIHIYSRNINIVAPYNNCFPCSRHTLPRVQRRGVAGTRIRRVNHARVSRVGKWGEDMNGRYFVQHAKRTTYPYALLRNGVKTVSVGNKQRIIGGRN